MGKPSGLAATFSMLASNNPAVPEPMAALPMKVRLDIVVICRVPFSYFPARTVFEGQELVCLGMFVILVPA
jgi:hypothetical protein